MHVYAWSVHSVSALNSIVLAVLHWTAGEKMVVPASAAQWILSCSVTSILADREGSMDCPTLPLIAVYEIGLTLPPGISVI